MKFAILGLLAIVAAYYLVSWARHSLSRSKQMEPPTLWGLFVGFLTDFFDTWGIGSFATTTSLFRLGKSVDDKDIPGTLNVGHTLPTILQAFIYINAINVDITTLIALITASILGSYVGATIVSRLPKRAIQFGIASALIVAVHLMIAKQVGWLPAGGEATSLRGWGLAIGIVGNLLFGALMTIGIGAYAPIMIMVSLLGMDPKMAFPLMMGSCAFLMPVASLKFIGNERYDKKAALGLTLGGLPAVVIAANIVQEIPPAYINWLVIVVVIYTALTMLYSAFRNSGPQHCDVLSQ